METRDRAWYGDRWDDVTKEDFEAWKDDQDDDEWPIEPWHDTRPTEES